MFWIYLISSILEVLMLMPEAFTALQFTTTPTLAFMLCCVLVAVVIPASFICKLKPGPFVYKALTIVLSVLIAFSTAGLSVGGIIMAVGCLIIFSRVKGVMTTDRDISIQLACTAIVANIPIGVLLFYSESKAFTFFGNITLFISTISAVLILVIRQVDDSRRFGKSTMGISTTQRKNNQLFAGIIIGILILAGSFGQVSTIYTTIIRMISRVFGMIVELVSPDDKPLPSPGYQMQDKLEMIVQENPSQLEKIIMLVLQILGTILLIGCFVYLIYSIVKFLIKTLLKIIAWFRNGQHLIDTVSEYGHIDEKESLLDRNLKNAAHRFRGMAAGLFSREVPYDKLPDDIAKVRRLLKNFIIKVRQLGVKVTDASTAQEICRVEGGISPAPEQLNALLADCYDKARYDGTAPTPEQLGQLEQHLLKK